MIPDVRRWRPVVLIAPAAAAPFKRQRIGRGPAGRGIVEFTDQLEICNRNNNVCRHVLCSPYSQIRQGLIVFVGQSKDRAGLQLCN